MNPHVCLLVGPSSVGLSLFSYRGREVTLIYIFKVRTGMENSQKVKVNIERYVLSYLLIYIIINIRNTKNKKSMRKNAESEES